jgi:hypothetical protein
MIFQILIILLALICAISGVSIRQNNTCPQFKNCLFYQATQNYTYFGCGVCEKEYVLHADTSGSGECIQKQGIRNCIGAVSKADILNGKPFCFECNRDYILRSDSMHCTAIPIRRRIKNCKSYYSNNTQVFCNVCNDGFTLDESRRKCNPFCSIRNCKNCQVLEGKSYCFNCKNGFVGIADEKMLIYRECLTCDEFIIKQGTAATRSPFATESSTTSAPILNATSTPIRNNMTISGAPSSTPGSAPILNTTYVPISNNITISGTPSSTAESNTPR